jgi:hypothetical protein
MAGSAMTFTYDTGPGRIKRVLVDWTSDSATGAVSGTTAVKLNGYLLRGVTDPSATAPTTLYDIVLTDDEGANILGNCADDLVDRSATVTENVDFHMVTSGARPSVCSTITVAVSNAGNSKLGQIILYLDGDLSGAT